MVDFSKALLQLLLLELEALSFSSNLRFISSILCVEFSSNFR